jgi:hypothetical protein
MRHFHLSLLFFLAGSLLITSCSDNDTGQEGQRSDQLEQYDILGEWQLEVRSINGITDAAVECCDILNLRTDEVKDDLSGVFVANGVGYETQGTFTLKLDANKLEFIHADENLEYAFQVNADVLTFIYEEAGDTIEENWRKQE